ncbi:MAG TPA: ABC transporter substrate-binding protein, partial [Alphaproteobacteria bacterium]|nr:ABC transporter substrate-binding protein [Alphaproteobacteria bacterium]
ARYTNATSIAAAVQEVATQHSEIQAVFIPDGGAALQKVAAQLALHGMSARQIPLLGTGLWDETKTAATPALIGGWYAMPDSSARPGFAQRYEKNFGLKPARVASLAYDATALAADLAGKGSDTPFNDAMLTSINGFAGVDGVFRLTPSGVAERGLAIMEITTTGPRVADPAPTHF